MAAAAAAAAEDYGSTVLNHGLSSVTVEKTLITRSQIVQRHRSHRSEFGLDGNKAQYEKCECQCAASQLVN
jgi:hypothetical protein